jgi:hypothetical protein
MAAHGTARVPLFLAGLVNTTGGARVLVTGELRNVIVLLFSRPLA